MRCTAAASLSIRRTRSADTVSRSSARCRASQVARTPAVVRPSAAASSNSSVVCRRSVSSRAPSVRPSTRAASRPSAPASSRTADGPRWRSTSDHPRRVSESSAVTASPPRSRSSAERPRNGVRAAARTRADRCGWAIASSRVSQDRPAGVPRTEPEPTRTVATPRSLERRRHDGQLRPDVREDRDMAWLQRPAVERRARGQEPGHVVGEVLGDDLPQPPDREPFVAGGAERRAVDDPQPERVRVRRTHEAGARPGGGDRPDEDLRVAELGALEQGGEPVDEGGVAAVVRGERGAPGRRCGRRRGR